MPTSDGKRVFSISELPAIDVAESFALGQNARVSKPQGVRGFNVLQFWSVSEEGKIKWEVGGAKSPTETNLGGSFVFLGPFSFFVYYSIGQLRDRNPCFVSER